MPELRGAGARGQLNEVAGRADTDLLVLSAARRARRCMCAYRPVTRLSRSGQLAGGFAPPALSEPDYSLLSSGSHLPAVGVAPTVQWAKSSGWRLRTDTASFHAALGDDATTFTFAWPIASDMVDAIESSEQLGRVEATVVVDPTAHDRVDLACEIGEAQAAPKVPEYRQSLDDRVENDTRPWLAVGVQDHIVCVALKRDARTMPASHRSSVWCGRVFASNGEIAHPWGSLDPVLEECRPRAAAPGWLDGGDLGVLVGETARRSKSRPCPTFPFSICLCGPRGVASAGRGPAGLKCWRALVVMGQA